MGAGTFPENLYCNTELRGEWSTVAGRCHFTAQFSESILLVVIKNPVLILRLRTRWHFEGLTKWQMTYHYKGWGTPRHVLNTTNVTRPLQVSCATKNVTRIKLELSVCQSFESFLRLESGFNASNSILFVQLPAKSQNCAVSLPGAQNFIMVLFRFKKPKMQAFIFKDTYTASRMLIFLVNTD